MPEYLRKRYGGKRLRIYYAVVSLALNIISGISVNLPHPENNVSSKLL